jgi:uncharacterized SAM-binding protein YcdF (DUF218 family)
MTRLVVGGTGALLLAIMAGTVAMWPRDDEPRNPDAVVVLGGAGSERARLGIELRDRYDAQLVLSSSASVFGEAQGAVCGEDAICFEPVPPNTTGEARNVAELAAIHGWGHVTVATSRFHSTRSRVLFRQCLGDDVTVVGAVREDGSTSVGFRRRFKEVAGTIAAITVRRAC